MQDSEGHHERLTRAERWRSVRGRSGGWSSGCGARCRGLNPATCPLARHGGTRNPECGAFDGFGKPLRLLPFVLIEGIFQGLKDRRAFSPSSSGRSVRRKTLPRISFGNVSPGGNFLSTRLTEYNRDNRDGEVVPKTLFALAATVFRNRA